MVGRLSKVVRIKNKNNGKTLCTHFFLSTKLSELMAQSVGASLSGLCHEERYS